MNRLAAWVIAFAAAAPALAQTTIQRKAQPDAVGMAVSVRAPDGPLVFTQQYFGADTHGDVKVQADQALAALAGALEEAGSDLAHVLRLNAYVVDDQGVKPVEAAIARQFATAPPAVTIVRSPLSNQGALVAFDAVAASTRSVQRVEKPRAGTAILPEGAKIFVSGQAQVATDLDSATQMTMDGLLRTLAYMKVTPADVVQVKAFVRPYADRAAALRRIAAAFAGQVLPPIVVMEWDGEWLAEIELVASAKSPEEAADGSVTYTFLPWLPRSPRFCNVTRVSAGTPLIFFGAVSGVDGEPPRAQMKTIFERLGSELFEAGSSFRALAKANYYFQIPEAKAALDAIRGVYFDPVRPPAASAPHIANGLGYPGRSAMIDMIAVPAGK